MGKKGLVSAEYSIVILLFLIILVMFVAKFSSFLPGEADKIRMNTACLEAETLADALLLFPGNQSIWEEGTLYKLGFGTGDIGELNYSKWVAAQNRGPTNISLTTNLNQSFLIKYSTYLLRNVTQGLDFVESGQELPNQSAVIYMPNASTLGVYVRNSDPNKALQANMEFFFPYSSIGENETSSIFFPNSGAETTVDDQTIIINVTNGSIAKLSFVVQNDSDQVRFYVNSVDAVFINRLDFKEKNTTLPRDFPVYFNGTLGSGSTDSCSKKTCPGYGTLLKDHFGASGLLVDPSSISCEVKRKMTFVNKTYRWGVDISVIAEG